MSDPATYRSKEEVAEYKERDPIAMIRKLIIENSYASEDQLKDIEKQIKMQIAEVAEYAISEPFPSEEELYTDIYK
jgi:pyruvate dehydrogenase E1 component alpha subunit